MSDEIKPSDCLLNAVERSICIYQALLEDIGKTYPEGSGGGITAMKQTSTTGFSVRVSQEERIDIIEYEILVSDNGTVEIRSKNVGVKSYD